MNIPSGSQIDRYAIEGVIGTGGMAVVYRATHADLGTAHAVKVLSFTADAVQKRLLQEGRIQAALRHENVVSVTDVIRIDGAPALVMEFVAGPSLYRLLNHYQPSLDQADDMARRIITGVMAAHELNLIHRDLKPANVLLASTSLRVIPKVADFGLAKIVSDAVGVAAGPTMTGATMGTPAYMAPEQFRNAKNADHRADVFALGAILYELVSGRPPFASDDLLALVQSSSLGNFRPIREVQANVPTRMARAIEGALVPDPEKRIQNCERLLEIWCDGKGDPSGLRHSPWEPAQIDMVRGLSLDAVDSVEETRDWAPSDVRSGLTLPPKLNSQATNGSSFWGFLFGAMALIAAVGLGVSATLVVGFGISAFLQMTPETPDPVPEVIVVDTPIEVPEPVVIEPVKPKLVSEPIRIVPSPKPVLDVPIEPEPGPQAMVEVTGVDRAYLIDAQGKAWKTGYVPPGTYTLSVFFTEKPTDVMAMTVAAGETHSLDCIVSMKMCR